MFDNKLSIVNSWKEANCSKLETNKDLQQCSGQIHIKLLSWKSTGAERKGFGQRQDGRLKYENFKVGENCVGNMILWMFIEKKGNVL